MKLSSMRIDAGFGSKWYKIKAFKKINECNDFLEKNSDFGLLKESVDYQDNPVYIIARNDDMGTDVLDLEYAGEDVGFCKIFYRADCGRLFAYVDGTLHTCNDDAWREPIAPVNHDYFNFELPKKKEGQA